MAGRWGQAGAGALSGAAAGSSFGPWGTAIGAGVGGITGYLTGGGDKDKNKQIPTLTGGQNQGLEQILQQMQGGQTGQNYGLSQDYLARILNGDQGAYDQFAAPYLQNFHEQLIPRLSEQFGALGGGLGGGVAGSSGFGQAIGGAASGLQAQLASLYANLQQNAAQQAMGQYNNLAGIGLGTQAFQPAYQPGNLGAFGSYAEGLFGGFNQAQGMNLGNKFSQGLGNWGNNKATGTDPLGGSTALQG